MSAAPGVFGLSWGAQVSDEGQEEAPAGPVLFSFHLSWGCVICDLWGSVLHVTLGPFFEPRPWHPVGVCSYMWYVFLVCSWLEHGSHRTSDVPRSMGFVLGGRHLGGLAWPSCWAKNEDWP